ncbi:acetyl-CoA carboxylase biotin carboxyl carrier protein [Hornefia butyriciproducens]|uniref:acetyl-CoA carboxylase biotin carboxyl carrier protein n=1 Tax=Hornefia butyriciproducens TaxID=2652293 RepID=UPI003F89C22E
MEKKEIFDLIKKFERSELTALEYETDGERLRLEKTEKKDETVEELLKRFLPLVTEGTRAGSGTGVSIFCEDAEENTSGSGATPETVKAPLVGIFYRAAAPGAKPFVEIGDTVKKGEVMCIIEAMKVMNEIKAPCDLTVTKVLGVDGELVDCGRTLFEVEKC